MRPGVFECAPVVLFFQLASQSNLPIHSAWFGRSNVSKVGFFCSLEMRYQIRHFNLHAFYGEVRLRDLIRLGQGLDCA